MLFLIIINIVVLLIVCFINLNSNREYLGKLSSFKLEIKNLKNERWGLDRDNRSLKRLIKIMKEVERG